MATVPARTKHLLVDQLKGCGRGSGEGRERASILDRSAPRPGVYLGPRRLADVLHKQCELLVGLDLGQPSPKHRSGPGRGSPSRTRASASPAPAPACSRFDSGRSAPFTLSDQAPAKTAPKQHRPGRRPTLSSSSDPSSFGLLGGRRGQDRQVGQERGQERPVAPGSATTSFNRSVDFIPSKLFNPAPASPKGSARDSLHIAGTSPARPTAPGPRRAPAARRPGAGRAPPRPLYFSSTVTLSRPARRSVPGTSATFPPCRSRTTPPTSDQQLPRRPAPPPQTSNTS